MISTKRVRKGVAVPAGASAAVLIIRLARLPDMDAPARAEAQGYTAYGRFALLRTGDLWFGDARSSHPATTKTGWYWAVDGNGVVTISARGSMIDGRTLFDGDRSILAWLLHALESRLIISRPRSIRLEI